MRKNNEPNKELSKGRSKGQMLKKLLTNHVKHPTFLALGVICLLSLFCIAVVIRSAYFRGDSTGLSQIVHIICLVFLTLLAGHLIIKKETAGAMRYFMLFLLNVYLSLFFSALQGSVYGLPEHSRQIAVLSAVDYFFSMLLFLTLWLYQKQFMEESVITRVVTVFISAGVIFYTGAIILNLHRPILFLITEDGTVKNYAQISLQPRRTGSICPMRDVILNASVWYSIKRASGACRSAANKSYEVSEIELPCKSRHFFYSVQSSFYFINLTIKRLMKIENRHS